MRLIDIRPIFLSVGRLKRFAQRIYYILLNMPLEGHRQHALRDA